MDYMWLIMKFAAHIAVVGMLASVSSLAQTKQTDTNAHSSPAKLERMPESLELRYAVSALPPHLRDGATTYILDPAKGYVLNNKGTNGMTCIVVRSDWQYTVRPFRDDIFWPVCYEEIWDCCLPQSCPGRNCLHACSNHAHLRRFKSGGSFYHEHASLYVLCPER